MADKKRPTPGRWRGEMYQGPAACMPLAQVRPLNVSGVRTWQDAEENWWVVLDVDGGMRVAKLRATRAYDLMVDLDEALVGLAREDPMGLFASGVPFMAVESMRQRR